MIFADTGAWFAAFVRNDPDHPVADGWLGGNTEPLVTTDYVVDELLTLLKIRGEFERAVRLGESLITGRIARLERITESDLEEAWRVFRDFRDKDWSFTDCTSYVVMQRLGIRTAFSFDHHFHQFGTVTVVP